MRGISVGIEKCPPAADPTRTRVLLYRCYSAAIPLLYRCYTAAMPLLYRCYTAAIPLLYHCYAAAMPLLYRCPARNPAVTLP